MRKTGKESIGCAPHNFMFHLTQKIERGSELCSRSRATAHRCATTRRSGPTRRGSGVLGRNRDTARLLCEVRVRGQVTRARRGGALPRDPWCTPKIPDRDRGGDLGARLAPRHDGHDRREQIESVRRCTRGHHHPAVVCDDDGRRGPARRTLACSAFRARPPWRQADPRAAPSACQALAWVAWDAAAGGVGVRVRACRGPFCPPLRRGGRI